MMRHTTTAKVIMRRMISSGFMGSLCIPCHDDYAPGHGYGEEKPETAKEESDE